jgi:phage terminase small subunit
MSDDLELTPKQRLFVSEYLIDLNATKAAERAGYSARSARAIGTENLAKPAIASAIRRAKEERAQRTLVSADWVIRHLKRNIVRASQLEPVMDKNGLPTGEYRWDGAVVNGAARLLLEHLGELGGKDDKAAGVTVIVQGGPTGVERDVPQAPVAVVVKGRK